MITKRKSVVNLSTVGVAEMRTTLKHLKTARKDVVHINQVRVVCQCK